ncbi:uncharacterized protein LOC131158626 [Malania oleifera]|uniref:uncharacterized protein LOC131158626 n=1 Tax=Malania oleifera TaxID=397392 RepID=UPI0025AEC8A4|nr:uncharacterized protein LOC131158626 [Malania oleifera]
MMINIESSSTSGTDIPIEKAPTPAITLAGEAQSSMSTPTPMDMPPTIEPPTKLADIALSPIVAIEPPVVKHVWPKSSMMMVLILPIDVTKHSFYIVTPPNPSLRYAMVHLYRDMATSMAPASSAPITGTSSTAPASRAPPTTPAAPASLATFAAPESSAITIQYGALETGALPGNNSITNFTSRSRALPSPAPQPSPLGSYIVIVDIATSNARDTTVLHEAAASLVATSARGDESPECPPMPNVAQPTTEISPSSSLIEATKHPGEESIFPNPLITMSLMTILILPINVI